MGVIILVVVLAIEISLTVFCLRTKSNQVKARSMFGIASFVGFMLLVILNVISWSFRYYALAFLLLLLSIIGVSNLIREKESKNDFKVLRTILQAFGMTVLFLIATLPAILFPQNKAVIGVTGDYLVSSQTYTYIDRNRVESYVDTGENRKLNVQFWYPDSSDELYPLIVFSHGGLGVKSSNESLFNELASHGYIVCSIDHTYQCFYTTDEDGETTIIDWGYVQELFSEDAKSDIEQSYKYYQKWMETRTEDIEFVFDKIISEAKNGNADTVYKLVNTEEIGVIGHSLGGSAALGIGRIRDDVRAVIALESPFMYDIIGVEDSKFVFTNEKYPVPVLNLYSDSSWSILSERPQYAVNNAMLKDSCTTVSNIHISGVGHLALTDFALTSPILTRILDGQKSTIDPEIYFKTINNVCLDFFNSYLKAEGESISLD